MATTTNPTFVFKILFGEESRRFGYEGALDSHALFNGLRQRAAALFNLSSESFTLSLHDCDESAQLYDPQPVLLKDFATFLTPAVQDILRRAPLDKKGRKMVKLEATRPAQSMQKSPPKPSHVVNNLPYTSKASISASATPAPVFAVPVSVASRPTFGQTSTINSDLTHVAQASKSALPSPFAPKARGGASAFGPPKQGPWPGAASTAERSWMTSGGFRPDAKSSWSHSKPGEKVSFSSRPLSSEKARDPPLFTCGTPEMMRRQQNGELPLSSFSQARPDPQGKLNEQSKTPYQPAYIHPMFKPAVSAQQPNKSAPAQQASRPVKNPFAADPNVQKLVSSGVCGEHRMKPKEIPVAFLPTTGTTAGPELKRKSELESFLSRMTELVEDTFGASLPNATSDKDCQCKRTEEVPAKVVHNATCDLCDTTIVGTRFKCLNCPDYDACSNCYRAIGLLHPGHSFVPLDKAVNLPVPDRKPVHFGVTCDNCNKTIAGVRYKCTHEDCPDYDLCAACEALPAAVHPHSHAMLKIRQPAKHNVPNFLRPAQSTGAHELVVDADVKEYPCTLQVQIDANRKLENVVVMEKPRELKASFVDDVTVPDGTKMEPGETFTKVFRVRNTGSESWPASTRMAFSANWPFSHAQSSVDVPQAKPGQAVDVELRNLQAPLKEGNHVSLANLQDDQGKSFGDTFWISINVETVTPAAPSAAVSPPAEKSSEELKAYFEALLAKQETPQEAAERALNHANKTSEAMLASIPVLSNISTKADYINQLEAHSARPEVSTPVPAQKLDAAACNLQDGDSTITCAPSAVFVKTFSVRNNGSDAWPIGTRLTPIRGGKTTPIKVSSVAPGQLVNVEVELQAPAKSCDDGKYAKYFQLQTADGRLFGDVCWVEIVVASATSSLSSSSIVMPTASTSIGSPVYRSAATTPVSEHSRDPFDDGHSEFTSLADGSDDEFVLLTDEEEEDF